MAKKKKNRDRTFVSATGSAFILTKGPEKWYFLGRGISSKVPYVLAHGGNKYQLIRYVKQELGFAEVEKLRK